MAGVELVSRKRNSDGTVRITGRAKQLKDTQTYTAAFGNALMTAWQSKCDPRHVHLLNIVREAIVCCLHWLHHPLSLVGFYM